MIPSDATIAVIVVVIVAKALFSPIAGGHSSHWALELFNPTHFPPDLPLEVCHN